MNSVRSRGSPGAYWEDAYPDDLNILSLHSEVEWSLEINVLKIRVGTLRERERERERE